MCSNISTDTMRSYWLGASNSFMSRVITSTLNRPRLLASVVMYSRCECEFETAVILLSGYCDAIHNVSEPQPQPSSRILCPFLMPACSQVIFSASVSASSSVLVSSAQKQELYLRCLPRQY